MEAEYSSETSFSDYINKVSQSTITGAKLPKLHFLCRIYGPRRMWRLECTVALLSVETEKALPKNILPPSSGLNSNSIKNQALSRKQTKFCFNELNGIVSQKIELHFFQF
jgi:hypothetical protein